MYKDVLGQELNVGDNILYTTCDDKDLIKGTVIGFTPQKIRVMRDRSGYTGVTTSSQIVKVTK